MWGGVTRVLGKKKNRFQAGHAAIRATAGLSVCQAGLHGIHVITVQAVPIFAGGFAGNASGAAKGPVGPSQCRKPPPKIAKTHSSHFVFCCCFFASFPRSLCVTPGQHKGGRFPKPALVGEQRALSHLFASRKKKPPARKRTARAAWGFFLEVRWYHAMQALHPVTFAAINLLR